MIHISDKLSTLNPAAWAIHGPSSYLISSLLDRPDTIYPPEPKICLVIGTFSSVPYIHLQLESRKRFCPHVPMLIHDDGSHKGKELRDLCNQYGVDFEQNIPRLPPYMGDLASVVGGLKWAKDRNYDILVKMSRRFLPIIDWTKELIDLASDSQYSTFSSWTTSYTFGFRTECFGMSVSEWFRQGLFHDIVSTLATNRNPGLVEAFMHNLARRATNSCCKQASEYGRRIGPRPHDKDGYAVWEFIGTDRHTKYPGFIWHNSHVAQDYLSLAKEWGLPYELSDFLDPNQGAGDKPKN